MIFNTPTIPGASRCVPPHIFGVLGLLALVSALNLIGCAKKQESVPSTPPVKACTLVTQAEMEALMGNALKTPEEQAHGLMSLCSYLSADSSQTLDFSKMLSFSVSVTPFGNRSAADAYAQYAAGLKKEANIEIQEVAGLGDKAGWSEGTKQLTIFTGKLMVVIGGIPADRSTLALNRQIAERALPRLPK